jgi:hypothetical protein
MKTNNNKAVSIDKPKNETVIFTDKYQLKCIQTILSATAGKACMMRGMVAKGEECLCSGSMQDAVVSMLEDIETAMYAAKDIVENKAEEE